MTEQTKHPNHEWIVAFAEGKQLQWRTSYGMWIDFSEDVHPGPWSDAAGTWRVKPESRWYRVAIYKKGCGHTWTTTANNDYQEAYVAADPHFSEWLTDRVEYTV